MIDEETLYDDPALRDAFRRGWSAWVEGAVRPAPGELKSTKEAKAWLDGYIAAEDAEQEADEEYVELKTDAEDAEQEAGVEDARQETDAEGADLDAPNPYSEDESQLRKAWKEGYHAGKEGAHLPDPDSGVYDDHQTELACVEGYQAGLEQKSKN